MFGDKACGMVGGGAIPIIGVVGGWMDVTHRIEKRQSVSFPPD